MGSLEGSFFDPTWSYKRKVSNISIGGSNYVKFNRPLYSGRPATHIGIIIIGSKCTDGALSSEERLSDVTFIDACCGKSAVIESFTLKRTVPDTRCNYYRYVKIRKVDYLFDVVRCS